MKIKEDFSAYEQLYKDGYLFDPDEEVFFSEKKKDFVKPKGFESWTVQSFNKEEYLKERMTNIGADLNDIQLELIGGVNIQSNERCLQQIFTANKKGDMEILQYSLKRRPYTFSVRGAESTSSTNREEYHFHRRHSPQHEHLVGAKYDFTNAKNVPFWPPLLIDNFEAEASKFDTLYITEGQIKSFAASLKDLPFVGLTSISHFRDQKTNSLHQEIFEYVLKTRPEKIVILWDGDCRDISTKSLEDRKDLATRPNNFYNYACKIREYIQEIPQLKKTSIFFASINSKELDGQPKGIDDLLEAFPNQIDKIKTDFENIGTIPSMFIKWIDITNDLGVKKMRKWFKIERVSQFYSFHQDKIQDKVFVFFNNTYDVEKGAPKIRISADVKRYKRIGTDFYRLSQVPVPLSNENGYTTQEQLEPWKEQTIKNDYGSKIMEHLEKYLGFTNQPSHTDYQQVIEGYWNLYENVNHSPEKGEFPHIKMLLENIFGDQISMIYDYLTLLYRKPTTKLPVICLVSKEQGTGKSTFVYLMKLIFKQNMAIISNSDLLGEFNAHWVSKLVVACEETILDKKDAYEKIKNLSTSKTQMRNEKNKTARDIPVFLHFVFCSNHEKDFIRIDDYDSRLWIRKPGVIKKRIERFDAKIESEISQFIYFLATREIEYKSQDRLYFKPSDFRTEAFDEVVANSLPGMIKDLNLNLYDMFLTSGAAKIEMTNRDIKNEFGFRFEVSYIEKTIKNHTKAYREQIKGESKIVRYEYSVVDPADENRFITRKGRGRPWVFERKDYVKSAPDLVVPKQQQLVIKTD